MDKYPKYISQEQQELFESYLLGAMTSEEKESFEISLKEDQNLRSEFDEFKALFETVEEAGLRSKLEDLHDAIESNAEVSVRQLKTSRFRFNYRIVASIAILMVLGGIWFLNRPNTNEQLFNNYYIQDPGLPTVMGENDDYNFYEAMVDYKQGKYEVAIGKWEKLLDEKPKNDTLNYFLGVSHLARGNEKRAISLLSEVIRFENSVFENEAHHYLGLVYLKQNKLRTARENLAKSNMQRSKELLSDLEK